MKTFKQFQEACWTGYKRKPGTKAYAPGSCVKEDGVGGIAVSGPTNVTGPQSGTDPVSATAVDMKKKKRYAMISRKVPN